MRVIYSLIAFPLLKNNKSAVGSTKGIKIPWINLRLFYRRVWTAKSSTNANRILIVFCPLHSTFHTTFEYIISSFFLSSKNNSWHSIGFNDIPLTIHTHSTLERVTKKIASDKTKARFWWRFGRSAFLRLQLTVYNDKNWELKLN